MWDELKKAVTGGKAIRATLAYVVGAAIAFATVEPILEHAQLPSWVGAVILVILMLGVPIVPVVAILLAARGARQGDSSIGHVQPQETAPKFPIPAPALAGYNWRRIAGFASVGVLTTMAISTVVAFVAWRNAGADLYRYSDRKPVIVGLYPSDSFGVPQGEALKKALAPHRSNLDFVDVTSSLEDMKAAEIEEVLDDLTTLMETRNVLGFVGPSVTESCPAVLNLLENDAFIGPVLLLTAADRKTLNWDNSQLALFRLNEGIDERADDIAYIVEAATRSDRKIHLVVEKRANSTDPDTYGNRLLSAIILTLGSDRWGTLVDQDHIDFTEYTTGDRNALRRAVEGSIARDHLILFLGVGGDFRWIVEEYYDVDGSTTPPAARLGGWMNAFATEGLLESRSVRADLIFEITDVDIERSGVVNNPHLAPFENEFGEVNPALRDQVFAYDSALILALALKAFMDAHPPSDEDKLNRRGPLYPVMNDYARQWIVDYIREQTFDLVSGRIELSDGQNLAVELKVAEYDGALRKWVPGDLRALFERDQQPAE